MAGTKHGNVNRIFNFHHWKDNFKRIFPINENELKWLISITEELLRYPKRIGRAACLLTYCNSLEEVIELYSKGHLGGASVNSFISRYGYKEGKRRYDEYVILLSKVNLKRSANESDYVKKCRSIWCEEYWISRGYNIDETQKQLKNVYNVISNKHRGKKRPGMKFPSQVSTWISKGLSENDAIKMADIYKQKCLTGKKDMIKRHGEIEGIKRYNIMIKKRKKSIIKHFETDGVCWKKASKESLQYFIPLYLILRKDYKIDRGDIFFGIDGSSEYYLGGGQSYYYLYDFTILSKKIIIEYNGERWHPNPSMNEEKWKIWKSIGGLSADTQYDKDLKKKQQALNKGFKYLEIWSNDSIEDNWNKINLFLKENLC